ncbi:MAG TPA: MarR family winged helix-turn-helix transcriptional regulator, partial [Actinomycetota bacterium]|nr:MarR family winged helix-turn-helix transcriptional regulator [Actinomycetota bacterium]
PVNTAALLGEAYSALGHRIVAGVAAAGFPQRPAHSSVFAHIDVEGGTRLTELAGRANITPQAMGELVDDLERMRYVERRPDPEDRRAKRIVLTRRGIACVEAAFGTIAVIERDLEGLLGSRGVKQLRSSLNRIIGAEGVEGERRV